MCVDSVENNVVRIEILVLNPVRVSNGRICVCGVGLDVGKERG